MSKWVNYKICDIFDVVTGTTPSTATDSNWKNGSINWFTPTDLSQLNSAYISESQRKITNIAVEKSNLTLMPPRSLLLSTRAPVGYVALLKNEATFNQGCKGLVPRKEYDINPEFYYYYLIYKRHELEMLSAGSTFKELSKERLDNYTVPLPPLPVQRKIAEIIGAADADIEKVDQAIAKTERLKKGLMQQLLTKGIGHTQFKNTELGKIPKEWEVVRLGELAVDFISGGTPSTANDNYWGGNIPWTTSAAISSKYVTKGMRQITKEGLTKSASNIVPKLNILLASRVGIGKVAVNTIDIAISQDLTGILVNKNKAYFDYVYWFLSYNTNLLKSMAQGSTIKGLLRKEIEKIYLPLPSINEQTEVSNILNETLVGFDLLNNKKEYYVNIKQSLMSDLLTGKRSVKV